MPPVNRKQPKRAASSESQITMLEFMERYPDDEACLTFLWCTRYAPDGEHAHCPKCDIERSFKRYEFSNRNTSWTCTGCGHHIHPTAGTIFHKSSTSLQLWFYAMFIMASTRCGVSAKQLERELGVTYKTAWRMFHLIRNQIMNEDDDKAPFEGEVEMDETFVGGKLRQSDRAAIAKLPVHQQSGAGKRRSNEKLTPVFGMVERGGRVRAHVVPSVQAETLDPYIHGRVLPSATVFTDTAPAYPGLTKKNGNVHHRINHSERVYVHGNVHTQTIEGFWSLVKNGIRGSHHSVSAKYLQGYLDEYAFRYNHRKDPRAMFDLLLLRAALTTPLAR